MNTIKILVQDVTLNDDAPVKEAEIPVLHSKGDYAVTRMIAQVNGQDVKYLYNQYTVTYRPSGRRCPVWFTSKKSAAKFCNWMARHFATGNLTEIKRRESEIRSITVECGGSY